jgi:hypothetical protein
MQRRFELKQRLENYKVVTNLLWDFNINEPVIKKANSNRLIY